MDWSTFNGKEPGITSGAITQYWRGDKSWQTLNSDAVAEGSTNLYYTDTRSRAAVSAAAAPLSYNTTTGAFSISKADASTDGYLSKVDWSTFNNKQASLTAGTGVNISSNTITIGQSVATTSTPNFVGATLSGLTTAGIVTNNASGVLGTTSATGTGDVVRANSPILTMPNLGTPSFLTLTNATGLPLSTGVTGVLSIPNGGTGSTTQSFVDLTTNQTVAGAKTFANDLTATTKLTVNSGSNSFSFPTTRGSNGSVLTSNGLGGSVWISANKTIEINAGSTVDITKYYTIYTGGSGFNLRLPILALTENGKEYIIKNLSNDASSLTISPSSSGTDSIEDPTTVLGNIDVNYGSWVKLVFDGTKWYVFKGN